MAKRYEKVRNDLNEAEQDAEELERQASDTGMKLVRARSELRQLQEQVKESDGRRIQLDDQCRQLARVSLKVCYVFSLLITKMLRPGDSKGTFRSSSQAVICSQC